MKKKIVVLLGPTATGKTDLGIYLAKKYNGELVSCDSRQVYKNLDIGSGKLPGKEVAFKRHDEYWEIDGIKVWMYDLVEPTEQYDVFRYIKESSKILKDILIRDKLPIIVGGTGLYINALINGIIKTDTEFDLKLREELENKSLAEIVMLVKDLSVEYFNSLNNSEQNNKRRLIRKIEILRNPHPTKSDFNGLNEKYDLLICGLSTDRELLNTRIDQRVLKRVKLGLIEEGRMLYENGLSLKRMRAFGLEYGVLADFLEKTLTVEEMVRVLQMKIHQYAKRQMTYFKRIKNVTWFDISHKDFTSKVEKLFIEWYHNPNA